MRWEDLPESQNVEDRRGEAAVAVDWSAVGGGFPGGAGGLVDRHDFDSRDHRLCDRHRSEHADRRRRPVLAPAAARRADAAEQNRRGRSTDESRAIRQPHPRLDRIDLEGHLRRSQAAPIVRRCWCSIRARPTPIAAAQAMAAMGPFYCPADKKIYLDTSFFQMIERRFNGCDVGSPSCRFAQAYVIAHEVGASRAERTRHSLNAQRAAAGLGSGRRKPTASRCGSSCRPIVSPASGPTARRSGSRPATSRRRCAPPARSATTRCSAVAGPGGAGLVHPRHLRAAPALVLQRLQAGHGRQLQHVLADGEALRVDVAAPGRFALERTIRISPPNPGYEVVADELRRYPIAAASSPAASALAGTAMLPSAGAAQAGLAPAADLLAATRKFLAGLDRDQRKAATFAWNAPQWRNWDYFGTGNNIKPGLRLER